MNQPLRKNLVGILYCGVQLTMKTTKSTYMHEYPDKFSKKPSLSKQIQLFNPKTPFVNPATETQLQSSSPKANPLNQSCLNVHVHVLPILSPLKLAILNLLLNLIKALQDDIPITTCYQTLHLQMMQNFHSNMVTTGSVNI